MCGIVGWLDWRRDVTRWPDLLDEMTGTMACRGPDGSGTWRAPRVGLGHRRLAILDPEGGAAPMAAGPGGRVAITYNGEIYNYRSLRAGLAARGHQFRTDCDTEVALHAYLEWGPAFVAKLNGIFAIAIWDGRTEELLLARDPLGVKPLYYTHIPGGLLFGSEPKALLAHPDFEAVLDGDGVAELFAAVSAPTPGRAALRDLLEVPPGGLVRSDRRGTRTGTYWRLAARPHTDSPDTTVATVRRLLQDSVRGQLVSDVPLCMLLSGGLDSSAVTAFGAHAYPTGELSSFAVDFRSSREHFQQTTLHRSLDAPYARAVATHLGTRHTEVVLDVPDLLAHSDTTMRARDLPGLGDADISLYLLFRRVAEDCKVALSGESADEVFGGYPWFVREAEQPSDFFPWYRAAPQGLAGLLSDEVRSWSRPEGYLAQRYREAVAETPVLDGEDARDRRMRQVGYLYLTRFLPLLLNRVDRTSMATGLEVRVPFCDHRLVEYVWNVPWSLKNLGGQEKGLLRRAVTGLLPDAVVHRPKSAYPAAQHPGYLAELRRRVAAAAADPAGPLGWLVHPGRLARLLGPAEEAPPTTLGVVRSLGFLLQFDRWWREYRVRLA